MKFLKTCLWYFRNNLHIVLCMSPVGSAFRTRCRMFPSLVNCCTIDWFTEWPREALLSVSRSFFEPVQIGTDEVKVPFSFFMPPPFEEWWRGIKCYPCLCVRSCVRPPIIKIWCPLKNFWKTASIQFKFGMLIYNIKTQVEFNLAYNPLIFYGLWAFYKNIVQKLVSAQ